LGYSLSEEKLISRSIEEFKNKLGIELEASQFAFIDNMCAIEDLAPTDPIEIKAYDD
jgi:hypothetical protein